MIDGDACPDRLALKALAQQYALPMIVFVDYAHRIEDDYHQVIYCEVGHDSVDMAIINHAQKDDIVVTQDYGLASLLLGKGVYVVHTTGFLIDQENIDQLLLDRYLSLKQRQAQKRTKGPSKRTIAHKEKLLSQIENIVKALKQ